MIYIICICSSNSQQPVVQQKNELAPLESTKEEWKPYWKRTGCSLLEIMGEFVFVITAFCYLFPWGRASEKLMSLVNILWTISLFIPKDALFTNASSSSVSRLLHSFCSLDYRRTGVLQRNHTPFIVNNLSYFLHYSRGMVFIFLFPIVQILCFLYAVGGDIRGIKLAVVNDETMNNACNRTDFRGTAIPYDFSSCHFMDMGCRFLKHLDDHPMMTLVSTAPLPLKAQVKATHLPLKKYTVQKR